MSLTFQTLWLSRAVHSTWSTAASHGAAAEWELQPTDANQCCQRSAYHILPPLEKSQILMRRGGFQWVCIASILTYEKA